MKDLLIHIHYPPQQTLNDFQLEIINDMAYFPSQELRSNDNYGLWAIFQEDKN